MASDDTTTADLAAQVAQLHEQLRRAQKHTALGELVGTTTHEFNNVLMTIINYAKLGARAKDAPTQQRAFEKILAAGQRAARLTNGILALARNRSTALEPTDLAPLVEDALLLLEREMQRYRIAVETHLPAVPRVQANGNQIQQVLLNLLINARQAMPEGGRLLVRLAHESDSPFVDLLVRDTGHGLPPEQLRRIFEPYYTTKSGPDATGKGGTGLGLSTCKEIIEAHQGRIRVDSAPGKGTAFTLRLPLAASPAGAASAPPLTAPPLTAPLLSAPPLTVPDATPAPGPTPAV